MAGKDGVVAAVEMRKRERDDKCLCVGFSCVVGERVG